MSYLFFKLCFFNVTLISKIMIIFLSSFWFICGSMVVVVVVTLVCCFYLREREG